MGVYQNGNLDDVLVAASLHNISDRGVPYSIHGSDVFIPQSTPCVQRSDLTDLFVSQLSLREAILSSGVPRIVSMSSEEQVMGINARGVVAGMANEHPLRDFLTWVVVKPRSLVRPVPSSHEGKNPVLRTASTLTWTLPLPTRVHFPGFRDMLPKSYGERFISHPVFSGFALQSFRRLLAISFASNVYSPGHNGTIPVGGD